jgi:hypothetical protein
MATFPTVTTLLPNGDGGIRVIGPAMIAMTALSIMAKLMVAIITEKTGSSFKGRFIIRSRNVPKRKAKAMAPTNARRNTQAPFKTGISSSVETKKKLTYAPTIINSPWAKLTTSVALKIKVNPRAMRA